MKTIGTNPLPERDMLSGGVDYYKPTMSQHWHDEEPDAEATFSFHNRGEQRILDYVSVDAQQQRFDEIAQRGWQEDELVYLGSLTNSSGKPVFTTGFLDYLRHEDLPAVEVGHDSKTDDIAIGTTGRVPLATFWETVVMGEVNEAYFEGYMQAHNIDPDDVYAEGDRRLSEKIAVLQQNPDIKFMEFGNRRHISLAWHKHVLRRLINECPENLTGTSNVALASTQHIDPKGTFAHEMPMIYAGLADARGQNIRASHRRFLEAWYTRYGADLSIALTDTFGSDFFFEDFTAEQAAQWQYLRHDSGNPFEFGEKAIRFYEGKHIDPLEKTIIFSDALRLSRILELRDRFAGRIGVGFGWGTDLTNDLGLKPLNIVMKATHVRTADGREADTVKLSDDAGKHTGPSEKIKEYQHVFRKLGATTLAA